MVPFETKDPPTRISSAPYRSFVPSALPPLLPLSQALAALFLVLSVAMLLRWVDVAAPLSWISLGSFIFFALIGWGLVKQPGAHTWVSSLMALILIFNCALLLYHTAHLAAAGYFALIMIGSGLFISSRWGLALVILAAWTAWGIAAAIVMPTWWLSFAYLNVVASLCAWLLQRSRLRREQSSTTSFLTRRVDDDTRAHRLRALIENTPDIVWSVDLTHRVTASNARFRKVMHNNFRIDIIEGEDILARLPVELSARWRSYYDRALAGERLMVEETYDFGDGPYHYEMSLTPIHEDAGIAGVSVFGRNVSKRKQIEAALRNSEERYATAVEGAKDGIWDWDLERNQIYYSPRWKAMLGYEPNDIGSDPDEWFRRVHPHDIEQVSAALRSHLNDRTPHFECEHRMQLADGTYRWFLTRGLAVVNAIGTPHRIAGSQTDITERKVFEEKLQTGALIDALTGLPNRVLFVNRLEHVMQRSGKRTHHGYGVLFLDVDRFKLINESFGHAAGDQLLITIAKRLQECLRPGDTVAHFSGDEFGILLEAVDSKNDAVQVAQRIKHVFTAPVEINGHEVYSTLSIGIALGHERYQHPQEMLRDADLALYRAKARGKARYEFFEPGMHEGALALLSLENDLRRAIHQETFSLFFQPIVDISTRKTDGFEALVRWNHPERGLVQPAEFIPLAEETGTIVQLGKWIVKCACEQLAAWNKQNIYPYVSVNVSAKQLLDKSLVKYLTELLETHQINPAHLRLEITESVVVDHDPSVLDVLKAFREMGIQLYLDDFGTGYSSLSYLHRLPVDVIKIDRMFVSRITPEQLDSGVVQTIVSLASSLGLGLVAEGVETEWQLNQLKALGCRYAQGLYFSAALPADEAISWIASSNISSKLSVPSPDERKN